MPRKVREFIEADRQVAIGNVMRCLLSSVLLIVWISGCADDGSYSGSSEAGSTFATSPPSIPELVTDDPVVQSFANTHETISEAPTKELIGIVDPAPDERGKVSTDSVTYPENIEVERLVVLANELQQKGEFAKALALVNRALQLDSNSPSASSMKANLEDLIRKI